MSELRGIPFEWLTDEFREAYAALCDVLYFGTGLKPEPGEEGKRSKRFHEGYSIDDEGLLRFKADVDRWLASEGAAVRRWSASSARARAGGAGSADRHGGDLVGAREPRGHRPELDT